MSDAAQLIRAFDADPASDWPLRSVVVGLLLNVGAVDSSSVAPMSQAPAGRVTPRWSLFEIGEAAHVAELPPLTAGLPATFDSGTVGVSPPKTPYCPATTMSLIVLPPGIPMRSPDGAAGERAHVVVVVGG